MPNHTLQTLILLYERRKEGVTTDELRSVIGQMSPAARIMELKELGAAIGTVRVSVVIDGKKHHNVARYVLLSLPKHLRELIAHHYSNNDSKGGK